ncbi:MAG: ferritin-like domain-containing protein [Acidimicrobiales bacterium]
MTKEIMHISEGELVAMTRDLDEMHHATLPKMAEAVREWRTSRRGFLVGAGAVASAAVLAACSSSSKSSSSSSAAPGEGLTGDLAVAALAAALENTAVLTYQKGIDAATAGKLGAVPPAVVTFAQTAQSQHKDHAAAWNGLLTQAGKTTVPANFGDTTVYTGVVIPALGQVKDVAGLANLALSLENVAAATYLSGLSTFTVPAAIKTAATIQPVEMQHAAILNFVLGNYPVPDSFAQTGGARTGSDQIGAIS